MSNRLRQKKLYISRYPANIARYRMLRHSKDKANPDRFKYLYSGAKRMAKDGYNSLKYKPVKIEFKRLYTWILVDLPHLTVQICLQGFEFQKLKHSIQKSSLKIDKLNDVFVLLAVKMLDLPKLFQLSSHLNFASLLLLKRIIHCQLFLSAFIKIKTNIKYIRLPAFFQNLVVLQYMNWYGGLITNLKYLCKILIHQNPRVK